MRGMFIPLVSVACYGPNEPQFLLCELHDVEDHICLIIIESSALRPSLGTK